MAREALEEAAATGAKEDAEGEEAKEAVSRVPTPRRAAANPTVGKVNPAQSAAQVCSVSMVTQVDLANKLKRCRQIKTK